ncbi:MAG: hypothetical protein KatS3mg010_1564 [Acidimicrobiia bacterium]|nr:MAG: hypothetical protein KatS3mg010_1564 [Acidimicrobiia bacterium]
MVEGAAVAAFAVGARDVYVGLKRSFVRECEAVRRAAQEMAEAGMLDGLDVTIAQGPGEYLFGEEKALLEVVEGKDPLPRVLPPFQHGLFATAPQLGWTSTEPEPGERRGEAANPTLVNNVESLAHVTWVLTHGVDEFRALGTPDSPGTTVFTACGDVARPGVYELPLGTPLRELVEHHAGGTRSGRPVKMVCSGVANPVLPAIASTRRWTTSRSGRRAAGWARPGSSCTTTRCARSRSRGSSRGSCTSSRAASARRASCSRV